jgi:hypothetical protein
MRKRVVGLCEGRFKPVQADCTSLCENFTQLAQDITDVFGAKLWKSTLTACSCVRDDYIHWRRAAARDFTGQGEARDFSGIGDASFAAKNTNRTRGAVHEYLNRCPAAAPATVFNDPSGAEHFRS